MPSKLFITTLQGTKPGRPPFWYMRQAGRYLPEYRELRATAKHFLDLCFTPEKAAEVTVQPVRRFGMDAAILFSDILVIPHALGQHVAFVEGEGPKLKALEDPSEIVLLSPDAVEERLAPVFDTVRRVRAELPPATALIGFAGSPWTVACYMLEGGGSRDFQTARRFAIAHPEAFRALIKLIVEASYRYLSEQIRAGAEAIQLFDSWAAIATEAEFREHIIAPTRTLVARLKAAFPAIPIIGFPRGAGALLADYARETGVDAVSVDFSTPLAWAASNIPPHVVLQGNLDPVLLAENIELALKQAGRICDAWGGRPFIFNLGHGMLPHTPPEHVARLSDYLKARA